ncbi:MAG: hypothetical protein JO001_17095 [Alphaproteobacteria bacterium]|nr:hypothetical protein [Alphaproteobacteria bacterium]
MVAIEPSMANSKAPRPALNERDRRIRARNRALLLVLLGLVALFYVTAIVRISGG